MVLERVETPRGELALRRCGEHFEVISNGTFLMDTRNGESERLLVSAALDRHGGPAEILIGGLGVGSSVRAAVDDPRVTRITVVEIEPAVINWNRSHLAAANERVIDDPSVEVIEADLLAYLEHATDRFFDVICLDIDNGPQWTVTDANRPLYDDDGTPLLARRLRPGGVLSIWSAARAPAYQAVLTNHFATVERHDVEVARGEPDVVMLASSARQRRVD